MANDYANWSKDSTISVEAYPGLLTSNNNTYENMLNDGNPDATTYNNTIREYILEKGYPVLYYPYLYDITKNEQISGEHSGACYGKPVKIYATLDIKDAPSWVETFGVNNQETFTANVHIDMFRETMTSILSDKTDERCNQYGIIYDVNAEANNDPIHFIEPHPKDLIQLTVFGIDRPWDRGNRIFEITNVEDEILSENFNNYFGHYVWKLTGVRYRYSYEDMMSNLDFGNENNCYLGKFGETGNNQVYDTSPVVKMFLGTNAIVNEANTKDMETEEGSKEFLIAQENSCDKPVIVKYSKVYDEDVNISEQSKQDYDMSDQIKNVYDEPEDYVETNGYL